MSVPICVCIGVRCVSACMSERDRDRDGGRERMTVAWSTLGINAASLVLLTGSGAVGARSCPACQPPTLPAWGPGGSSRPVTRVHPGLPFRLSLRLSHSQVRLSQAAQQDKALPTPPPGGGGGGASSRVVPDEQLRQAPAAQRAAVRRPLLPLPELPAPNAPARPEREEGGL